MPTLNNGYAGEQSRSYEGFRNTGSALDQHIPASGYMQAVATPQYMLKMDELVKSTVQNFEQAIQLFHFDFEASRPNNPNVSNDLMASGRVIMANPSFVIPCGTHLTEMMKKLVKGELVNEITVTRLQNINNTNETGETIVFKDCFFQNIKPMYDTILFNIRFVQYEHTIMSYDQKGVSLGNTVASYDLSRGESQ